LLLNTSHLTKISGVENQLIVEHKIAWVYALSRLNNDTQIEGLLNAHVDTIN